MPAGLQHSALIAVPCDTIATLRNQGFAIEGLQLGGLPERSREIGEIESSRVAASARCGAPLLLVTGLGA